MLLVAVGTAVVRAAFADTVNIVNNVSASATTGGNSGTNVTNGTATVEVHIERTINGVSEPPIDVATSSPGGTASVSIESELHASGTNTHPTESTTIAIDQETASTATTTASIPTSAHRNFMEYFQTIFENWFTSFFKLFKF